MKDSHTLSAPPKLRCGSTVLLRTEQIAFSAKEAAHILGGISVRSLKRLEERGLIKSCKALRRRLYSRRELERFLEANS